RAVPALGGWQLARRPARYARSALLLMLALAIGLFAVSYTRTWKRSQQDQANFQTGADLRVRPDIRYGTAIPLQDVETAYSQVDGVQGLMPVLHDTIQVSRSAGSADVIAIDALQAPNIARFRPDLADRSLANLLQPLAEARPQLPGVTLPGQPQRLAFDV